jgi:outer membrane receptor for ferrienterochelin and colicins
MRHSMKFIRPLTVSSALSLSMMAAPALAASTSSRCQSTDASASDLLTLDIETLVNVNVTTASKFSETAADAPGVISVVTQDELRRFGGTTLGEILTRVPGIGATSAYFTDRSMVAARGDQTKINGGHILFLINGRPTREVLEGGLVSDLIESFPISALDRIEVVKGPGSVLYGSNAFSAVVNLITLKPDHNELVVAALPGAGGTADTSARGTYSCGEFGIVGAFQIHQKPDSAVRYGYSTPIPNDPLASTLAVQDVTIPNRSAGGYLGAAYRGLSFSSSITHWTTSSFVRGIVGDVAWTRQFADVGYAAAPSDRWKSTFNVTFTRNTLSAPISPSIERDSNEVVAEWTNAVTVTERDRATLGFLYDRIQGHETYLGVSPSIQISNGSRGASTAYGQLDHRLLTNVKLIGGVQVNQSSDNDLDAVPRAGVIWHPASAFTVKALYGKAFRSPSINETTLNHPGLEGTPGLRPEVAGTFDLELGYSRNRVEASIDYFRTHQTDSITVDARPVRWKYVNLGEATFHGVAIDGKYYVMREVLVVGSVSYQGNEDGNGVSNITPVANMDAKLGLSYRAESGATVSVFDVYSGTIDGYNNGLNPAPASSHMLSLELRVNASQVFATTRARGLAFVLHGDNLANQQLWVPDWGGNSGGTIPSSSGRSLYVGAELTLNGATIRAKP